MCGTTQKKPLKLKISREKLIAAITARRDSRIEQYAQAKIQYEKDLTSYPKRFREEVRKHLQALKVYERELKEMADKCNKVDFKTDRFDYVRPAQPTFHPPHLPYSPRDVTYELDIRPGSQANIFDTLLARLNLSDDAHLILSENDIYFQYAGA